ncbi:general substrate transporter [Byssothecium circinans]|uniref:General substrate transporter n=1 Tax=Byssothecium circinans TaxID=147558 RepID=A0A6A5TLT6_9PLEO|nr:general substrate transporter [Byssothecium circinans]
MMEYTRSVRKTSQYCLVVGLGAILFGLDQGCISGLFAVPKFIQDFGTFEPSLATHIITANGQTLLFGTLLAGTIIACVVSGPIGSRLGRKAGLYYCIITSIIGPIIQIVSPNVGVACLGRIFSGAGIGFAANFCIMYWAEVTPATYRGMIVMMYQGLINLAQFVGACINEGTHNIPNKWAWRAPLMSMLSAPLVMLAFLPFIPDTPRWFVHRNRIDEAHLAMRKIRGKTWSEDDVTEEIRQVVAMDCIERELEGSSSYWDCFKGSDHRRTRIAILTLVVQQFTGISFISGYGTYFFSVSGISNPFTITVITSVCGLAGSISAFPLVKYFGRRPLLIVGGIASALSMLIFAIVGVALPNSVVAARCLAAFVCTYLFTYGATWGPIPQAIIGEIPSNRLRSRTVSLATSVNWMCTLFIICGSPYLLSPLYINLGTKLGFIFGGCTILGTIWVFFELPETKDRTLEEIDEMFLNRVPARKFSEYVSTGQVGQLNAGKMALDKEEVDEVQRVDHT